MATTFHPFRPKLEGLYLERFVEKVRALAASSNARQSVDTIAHTEYEWATHAANINPRQRTIYRAVWLFLRDLIRAGWNCRWQDSALELSPPEVPNRVGDDDAKIMLKDSTRASMADARRSRIWEARDFVERMEAASPTSSRVRAPISKLITDGTELADDLEQVTAITDPRERMRALRQVVRPYLQLVREGDVCPESGQKLSDIWRYFRLTWATPAENTPGRTLLYLVRDAARPYHPVMGLASLENAPIKIACRDHHLGWSLESFEESLRDLPQVERRFGRLIDYIDSAITGINLHGLCSAEECSEPTQELIEKLLVIARRADRDRLDALRAWQSDSDDSDECDADEKSSMGNIPKAAEDALFARKRADQLARLLTAKRVLSDLATVSGRSDSWSAVLQKDSVRAAIRTALQSQKSRHIGTSIMELNVCGAIPPYNEILGGKLVALMMLSPQVINDYRQRYGERPSDIASRLKGEQVVRPAELVYMGTTSLYRVGTSQYNRLRLPTGALGSGSQEVRWTPLGETTGYGTLHIGRLTLRCLEEVANQDGVAQVNHVFGEGPSPKLRIIRQALDAMFEPGQREATDQFHRHAMARLVYGAKLATNALAFLHGESSTPEYYHGQANYPSEEGTARIVEYWRQRWLDPRLSYQPALERLSQFRPASILVSRDLTAAHEPVHCELASGGGATMGNAGGTDAAIREHIRNLHRGTSAYADRIQLGLLQDIHIPTDVDSAILDAVVRGQSVVLTGNPGDGKSHLLRVLAAQMKHVGAHPRVMLDASSVSDDEIIRLWEESRASRQPFCAAINQAVLFHLADRFPNFAPIQQARRQVEQCVTYDHHEIKSEFGDSDEVAVFDLSRRDVLSERVVTAAIDRLCTDSHSSPCNSCPAKDCDYLTNRSLLASPLVRKRIQAVLDRVSLTGYHATLRELQGFISYLLFGGRDCAELVKSSGAQDMSLPQLVFMEAGRLFEAIRSVFDPSSVTHPIWDERLVSGQFSVSDWVSQWRQEVGSIEPTNGSRIAARKRAFYLFHSSGHVLLESANSDAERFRQYIHLSDQECLRQSIRMINRFFGSEHGHEELRVWQSHRYNHAPRRILYSALSRSRKEFELVRPSLCPSMSKAFSLPEDHVVLRLKGETGARLRIDYALFGLLAKAERGVPVMFLESDETRRLWGFMESLATRTDVDDDVPVVLLDPISGEQMQVVVDPIARRYVELVSSPGRRRYDASH